jgi:RNA polymerase sigma factor (sigma-70 family)
MSQSLGTVLQVFDLARRKQGLGVSDGQLLSRYLESRDQEAFALLVKRHGPMVWGVCSRVLRCPHDAADSFQATFLVLARRAESISPRERVGFWLYGVARLTALRARVAGAKRSRHEMTMEQFPEPAASNEQTNELTTLIDQTLSGLPAKYRLPIVLCDLEEKSHREVATQLGWPVGTVAGRLVRGRKLLATRLARQGIAIPCGGVMALTAQGAGMPSWLVKETAHAASLFAAVPATGGASATTVTGLAMGVMNAMFWTKCKVAAGIVLTLALSIWAVGTAGWAQANASAPPQGGAVHDPHQDRKIELKLDVKDTPLRTLQREKVAVLTKAMNETHALRAQGKATFMDAAQSHHALCKAEFELANNDEDRLKAITKQVKWAKEIEVNAKKLNEDDKFPQLDLYKVITDRIDAEIAMEKLKASVHGEHKHKP